MRRSWIAFCAIGGLLGLLAGVELRNASIQGNATLDVEALITKGSLFRVYYNNNYSHPGVAAIRAGEWHHYKLEVPARITSLRFDPSDTAGAQMYVRSIVLRAPGKTGQPIPVSHLLTWFGAHVTATTDNATASVLLTTDAPASYWMASEQVAVANDYALLSGHFRLDGITMLSFLLIAGVMILLAGIRRAYLGKAALAAAVIFSGLFCVATSAVYLADVFHGSLIPVNHAVGGGAFSGLSLNAEYFTANVPISLGLILALFAGLVWSRARTGKLLPDFRSTESSQSVNLWLFAFFFVLLAVFVFPRSADYLNQPWGARLLANTDEQTVFSWEYLVYHGALPWRDFWFPYGGFASRMAPVYPYYLYEFGNQLLLAGVIVWSALKIWSNRWGILAGVCLLYLVLGLDQVFSLLASERYLLGLSIILLCVVAAREATLKYFAAFGIWCAYVVTQEASQVVYALPGSIVLLLAAIAGSDSTASRMRMIRAIAVGAFAALGGTLVYFSVLYSHSQLGGWVEFMTTLNDSAAYSAGPASLKEWFSGHGDFNTIFLIGLVVLLMGGILNLSCRKSLPGIYVFLPICIGLLGWVLLQKEIMRGGVITQILPIPFIGLTILLFQVRASIANRGPDVALSFCLAFVFGCFVMDHRIADPLRNRWAQSERLPSHISAAFFHPSDWPRTTAAYFSPSRFQFGDISGTELKDQLSSAVNIGPNDTFYVLGNNSEIYALFGKMAPYSIYLYNMSPLNLQLRTTSWMEENHTKYIFWDSIQNDFDGVPNEVRLPVVYRYVLEHYKLSSANSRYRILERLDDGERPNLDPWFGLLGSSVYLGYIPAASSLTESYQGPVKAQALVVHVSQPVENAQARVALTLDGRPYTILFSEKKQKSTYIIRLDRIPLLAAGLSIGADLRLVGNGNLTAEIRSISVPKDDLY